MVIIYLIFLHENITPEFLDDHVVLEGLPDKSINSVKYRVKPIGICLSFSVPHFLVIASTNISYMFMQ